MVKPMLKAFESAFDTLKGVFNYASTAKEHQSETEIIKDRRDIDEANKDALRALKIADRYKENMTIKDRFLFRHFYSEFLKEK